MEAERERESEREAEKEREGEGERDQRRCVSCELCSLTEPAGSAHAADALIVEIHHGACCSTAYHDNANVWLIFD